MSTPAFMFQRSSLSLISRCFISLSSVTDRWPFWSCVVFISIILLFHNILHSIFWPVWQTWLGNVFYAVNTVGAETVASICLQQWGNNILRRFNNNKYEIIILFLLHTICSLFSSKTQFLCLWVNGFLSIELDIYCVFY